MSQHRTNSDRREGPLRRLVRYLRGGVESTSATTGPVARAAPGAYELAYEEARRALDEQERGLAELRSRAGVVLGAAAVTMSFFGSRLLNGASVYVVGSGHARVATTPHRLDAWSWLAIASFALLGAAVLSVMWPGKKGTWHTHVDGDKLFAGYLEPENAQPKSILEIHRNLAIFMHESWKNNDGQIRLLQWAFRGAVTFLMLEVGFWVVSLATHP
jgi:hypothetical protein